MKNILIWYFGYCCAIGTIIYIQDKRKEVIVNE